MEDNWSEHYATSIGSQAVKPLGNIQVIWGK